MNLLIEEIYHDRLPMSDLLQLSSPVQLRH